MAIILELQQVTEEETEPGDPQIYTVTVRAIREGTTEADNKIIGRKNFQVTSAVELKNKMRPIFEAIIATEQRKQTMLAVAQAVIDELMVETIQ